uniref:Uncharacterized protein n=1 Tax=Ectopseudomonas oleovorans TaxID=301 RepID=A0A653B1I8_ECTOL
MALAGSSGRASSQPARNRARQRGSRRRAGGFIVDIQVGTLRAVCRKPGGLRCCTARFAVARLPLPAANAGSDNDSVCPGGSDEAEGQRFGDVGRFLLAFDLQYGACLEQPLAGVLLVGVGQRHHQAHPGVDLDRLDEAYAVEAVVHRHLQALRHDHDLFHQHRYQRQREEAMGDGGAEGRQLGLFRIDVDELVIAGALGELVDALLIDGQPLGFAEFLANLVLELCYGYERHSSSLRTRVFFLCA